jgi:hypothetical protein
MKVDIEGPARWVFMRSEQCKSITGKNVRVCHTPIKSTWRLLGFEFKSIHMTDINTTHSNRPSHFSSGGPLRLPG